MVLPAQSKIIQGRLRRETTKSPLDIIPSDIMPLWQNPPGQKPPVIIGQNPSAALCLHVSYEH